MNDEPQPPSPMKLLGRAARSFTRMVDVELRNHGFATSQLPVLIALKGGAALSQAELARLAQVEQPSMAQLLNRMERDGLVERVPDPVDKRSRLISLTAAAARRMPKARTVMQAHTAEAMAGFSEEEAAKLVELLIKLNAALDRMSSERGTA